MKERIFAKTGLKVSEVGLGCWQLGGADWGAVSEADALATLNAARDNGVTFFDTADIYGMGRSEQLIRRFLEQTEEKPFVATKIGRSPEPGWPDNFSLPVFRQHVEGCLHRLGVDVLDLVQLHCLPAELLRRGEVFELLRVLKREGKIREFGASVETVDEALGCLEQEGLASLQIIFNIFRQKPIPVLFSKAEQTGVALIVRLPLASGLLTGKFTRDTKFSEADHRNYNRDGAAFHVGETFAGLPFDKGVSLANELEKYVPPALTLTQLALRWCLDFPAVTVVIPGARNPDQARANAGVSELPPLSSELHDKLQVFYECNVAEFIRGPY